MKLIRLFSARYESANFSFEGVGETSRDAVQALERAIHHHCRNTGARREDFYNRDEVYVRELVEGDGWVDDFQINPGAPSRKRGKREGEV